MTVQPCTVDHGLALEDARDRMWANKIRHLLVMRGGHLCGVLSERDISLAMGLPGMKLAQPKVEEAMSTHVYACQVDTPLEDVVAEMEAHRYGCAVVLDDEYVVGIFTTTDALRVVRTLLTGAPVEPMAAPTHLVDLTGEREKVTHHVRLGALLRNVGPRASDGLIGTTGLS